MRARVPLTWILTALILLAPVAAPGADDEPSTIVGETALAVRIRDLSDRALRAAADGRAAEAQRLLDEAGTQALPLPIDDPVAPLVLASWAQSRVRQGRWEGAEAIALEASDRARAVGDPAAILRASRILAESRRLLGHLDEAAAALAEADAVREIVPASDVSEVAELDFGHALVALDRHVPADALVPLSRAIGAALEQGLRGLELRARLAHAEALSDVTRSQDADFELQLAREIAADDRERADVEQRTALIYERSGRHGAAVVAVVEMLDAVQRWIGAALTPEERHARSQASRGYVETAIAVRLRPNYAASSWPEAVEWIRRVRGESDTGRDPNEFHALWFWGAKSVTGLVTPPGGTTRVVSAGDPDTLREWIFLFRSLLASPDRAEDRAQVGRWLASALFGGVMPSAATVRVEPDGPLTALPFALLPGVDDEPLGLSVDVVNGARRDAPGAAPDSHSSELLVLADPRPPANAPSRAPLPGARREAHRIAGRVPGTRILFAESAMESRVAGATIPAVLHVAAHTSPDPDRPALLLAPGEGRDGWLTPEEIRRLPHVPQIVVLSRCENLLTDVSGRSSVSALGSAFLEAGTSTVVDALWKVENDGPGALMAAFHFHLRAGRRPSRAMRLARTEMAQRADSDPFSWGAFVVRGRDQPVHFPQAAAVPRDRRPEAAMGAGVAVLFAAILLRARWRQSSGPSGRRTKSFDA